MIKAGDHCLLAVALVILGTFLVRGESGRPPDQPKYRFDLSEPTFSVLGLCVGQAASERRPIQLEITAALSENRTVFQVETRDASGLLLVRYQAGSELLRLLNGTSLSNLGPAVRDRADALVDLGGKIETSLKHPVWPEVSRSGTLGRDGDGYYLIEGSNRWRLAGLNEDSDSGFVGKRMVTFGHSESPGQFTATRWFPLPERQLEIFTMSQCPHGLRAVRAALKGLGTLPPLERPRLVVRQIFYAGTSDGANVVYRSLHGPAELEEGLVQIAFRETDSEAYLRFLGIRLEQPTVLWQEVARRAGVEADTVERVKLALSTRRLELLHQEHEYALSRYGIGDGSPTLIWEGQKVESLREVPGFERLALETDAEKCKGD